MVPPSSVGVYFFPHATSIASAPKAIFVCKFGRSVISGRLKFAFMDAFVGLWILFVDIFSSKGKVFPGPIHMYCIFDELSTQPRVDGLFRPAGGPVPLRLHNSEAHKIQCFYAHIYRRK
jgi:hypothetical protein